MLEILRYMSVTRANNLRSKNLKAFDTMTLSEPSKRFVIFVSGVKFDSPPRIIARLLHMQLLPASERGHPRKETFERTPQASPQTQDQFKNLFRGRKTNFRGSQKVERNRAETSVQPLRVCD